MTLISTGLTNGGLGAGVTTNFVVQYESTLANQARIVANANALIAVLETEFTVTTGWFNSPPGKFGASHRQQVNLNIGGGGGGNNTGYGGPINIDSGNGSGSATTLAEQVKMVWMNEWVEILMSLSGGKWNAGDSSGEALSQYCGIVRFQTGHYSYYGSWVNTWLNATPRQDWVTSTESTDGNAVSFGCALAFLYYLNTQLGFTINEIIAAGSSTLAGVYRTLTGDTGNPYPFFAALLERVFPSTATANVPGPISDDPFPIAMLSFVADKNTFGKDEVQDVITTSAGRWPRAFWLAVDGFSKNSFQSLGIAAAAPTGPFASLLGVSIDQRPDIDFENAAAPRMPQRIRIPFDIVIGSAALGQFPASGSTTRELDGTVRRAAGVVPGGQAAMLFELVSGADPYFTNIDPTQNNVSFLSQDLRVFTATPGLNPFPVPGGPQFGTDSVTGAYGYVQALLGWLNSTYPDPSGTDPFASVLPGQAGALRGDSSVTPFSLSGFPLNLKANYNFAIARVRMRGTAGPAGRASVVRVFFRLWSTQTADTDYQPNSTYLATADTAGLPGRPLPGSGHTTLPFFATANNGAATDYAAGGPNQKDITITTGDSIWVYYGCFLNVYDPGNQIDGRPVQGWLNGTHHCLVAQLAFDGTPLFVGESPQSSDKLAQRNLQVTVSDNPGPASTHRVPQTFDLRPSRPPGPGAERPDELMIDWGTVPFGSVGSLFWPALNAADVIALAQDTVATHTLTAVDANTIQVPITGGISYIPIPPTVGENFAGLLTVDLPSGVTAGQEYTIVVRRLSTKAFPSEVVIHSLPANVKGGKQKPPENGGRHSDVPTKDRRGWRYVVGTFQVTIPVTTGEHMLPAEENTLAILKWRLGQLPATDRWYPVIQRLVGYVAARVDGLGGSSAAIPASPDGAPLVLEEHPAGKEFTGYVSSVVFDCFGNVEAFMIEECCGERRRFRTSHERVAELALRACRYGLRLSVIVSAQDEDCICQLILRT